MSAEESRSSRSEAPQSGDLHGDAAAGSCPSERRADSRPQDAAAGSAAADTHGAVQADGNGSDSGPAGTDGTDGTDGTVVPPDSAQAADATASSAGDAAGPGNGGGKDGGALAASAEDAAPAVSSGAGVARGAGWSRDEEDMPEDEKPMSFTEHLGELRMRIVRMLIGAAVGFLLCYGVAEDLFRYLSLPLVKVMPPDTRFIYTSVPEAFFVYLKVAFVAGVFVASPYIFYQLWAFIAPGLYREERRHIVPLAFCSAFFFLLGAAFCYWGVFPFAFTFFMSYSKWMVMAMPSLNEYLGFSLNMLLAFGLIFEMPLFAFFFSRVGIITPAWMRKVRRYAILAIFIVAAILTPPDVFSQLLMAGPMIILYEVSIYVAAMARPRSEKAAAESGRAGSSNA